MYGQPVYYGHHGDHIHPGTYHPYYGYPTSMQMMGVDMGMATNGTIFQDTFIYSGNPMGLQTRIESFSQTELASIKQANIVCNGLEIKSYDICCMITTIVLGSILIFPLFFMCCEWWKKKVHPAYEIPIQTYKTLAKLISLPALKTMNLNLRDNKLNAAKSQILYDALSRAESLKGFTLFNTAMMNDF